MIPMESTKKSPKRTHNPYPPETKSEATTLSNSCLSEYGTRSNAAKHVAGLLDIGCYETVLIWTRGQDIDAGVTPGATTSENEGLKRLRKENAGLRRTEGILKAASAIFAAGLDRPQSKQSPS